MEPNNNFYQCSQASLEQTGSLPLLLPEAIDYLRLFYQEQSLSDTQLQERSLEIERDYWQLHTY